MVHPLDRNGEKLRNAPSRQGVRGTFAVGFIRFSERGDGTSLTLGPLDKPAQCVCVLNAHRTTTIIIPKQYKHT